MARFLKDQRVDGSKMSNAGRDNGGSHSSLASDRNHSPVDMTIELVDRSTFEFGHSPPVLFPFRSRNEVRSRQVVLSYALQVDWVIRVLRVTNFAWRFIQRVRDMNMRPRHNPLRWTRGEAGLASERPVLLGIGLVPHFCSRNVSAQFRQSNWMTGEPMKH